MKFGRSYNIQGMIGLLEKNENGNYEETYSFTNISSAQNFIDKLQKALNKYKKSEQVKK